MIEACYFHIAKDVVKPVPTLDAVTTFKCNVLYGEVYHFAEKSFGFLADGHRRRKRRMSAAAFSQIRYRDIAGDVFNSEQRCPSSTSVAGAFASTHQKQQRQQHDPLQVVNAGSSSVPSRFVSNEPSE